MAKRPLWDTRTIAEVISDLLNWGHGSGEELFDYLSSNGLSSAEARTVMDLLTRSIERR